MQILRELWQSASPQAALTSQVTALLLAGTRAQSVPAVWPIVSLAAHLQPFARHWQVPACPVMPCCRAEPAPLSPHDLHAVPGVPRTAAGHSSSWLPAA